MFTIIRLNNKSYRWWFIHRFSTGIFSRPKMEIPCEILNSIIMIFYYSEQEKKRESRTFLRKINQLYNINGDDWISK